MKPQDGRRVKSPAHRAAISLGLRRAAWSQLQARRAHRNLVHDLVPVGHDLLEGPGGPILAGGCHWCQFWGTNPGHTGRTFQDYLDLRTEATE